MPDRDQVALRIADVAREFYRRGWCLGTSGNFSAVLERDPLRLLVTVSGVAKGALGIRGFQVVDASGRPVETGSPARPSAETLVHVAIIDKTDAASILHTHSVSGTLLGMHHVAAGGFPITGFEMLKGLEGITTHEADVFVPVLPNTQDMAALAEGVRDLLDRRPATRGFLIAGHGLYTWGRTLEDAERQVEIFEFLFECLARRTRFEPHPG
jgi:methylthioribulose-1-phosphate dehydratase